MLVPNSLSAFSDPLLEFGTNADSKIQHKTGDTNDALTFSTLRHDEATIEALRSQDVGDELMACWVARENKSLRTGASGLQSLPASVRSCALQSLQYMVKVLQLPTDEWFTAATVFDRYCHGLPVEQCIRSLPCICCAVARLLKTVDDATCCLETYKWSQIAAQMAGWLEKLGHAKITVPSLKDIRDEELSVIQAMDWQLSPPTVYSWLLAFCTRLDVLTQREFTVSLQWAWSQGFPCATHLVAAVSFAETKPCTLTTGLLALLLISAGLLKLHDLQPESLGEEEWLNLFNQAQPSVVGVPQCALEQSRREHFMTKFCEAVGCNMADVKDHGYEAACALREAQELYRAQPRVAC